MATIVHDTDLICRDCGLEFRRLDHLKRHAALHNGRKPFACSACGRSFSRRDTLQRHIAVHQPSDPAVSPQAISATDRSEAACSHCRASKLKCDGTQPCNRCAKKGVECAYLPRRMRQVKKLHIRPGPESPTTESETQNFSGGDDNAACLTFSHVSSEESTSSSLFRPTPASTATPADMRQLWQELLSQAPLPSPLPVQGMDATMNDLLNISHEQGSFLDLPPWSPTLVGGFLARNTTTWPAAQALPVSSPGEGILGIPSSSSQKQPSAIIDMDVGIDAETYGHVPPLSLPKYDSVAHWAMVLIPGAVLPPIEPFNAFIQLYFEHFHDLMPILHRPTFDPNTASSTLVLTIAHVVRHFSKLSAAEASATALAELAGAAVAFHVANGLDKPDCQPWLAQTTILCQIAAFFGDNKARIEKALAVHATVGHICRRIGCYHDISDPPDLVMGAEPDFKVSWEGWVHAEGLRRIAFAYWLLDSQCCLMLGVTPTILTESLRSEMPCHESPWSASTPTMWRECMQSYNNHSRAGTLRSELERLYAGEAIPGETGSFARLLILFGTYRDSLFLKQAHDSGLSLVLNTHGQAVSHDDLCKRPVWDILDPERRGSTGGGMESMIFQSYHLIGLSQYFTVNELYSFSGFEVTPLEQRETTRRLASWCAQNGDSARKAAMHAGRLFSHCQSSLTLRGYQEPRVMLIATLALWAYSTLPLTPLLGPFGRCSPSTCTVTGSSSPDAITTCRIDRSSDDSQAARDWVRSGCHTRCFIEGLGNLHGPNADARIVRRAIALLAPLHEWRLGRAIARELKRLFDVFWVER